MSKRLLVLKLVRVLCRKRIDYRDRWVSFVLVNLLCSWLCSCYCFAVHCCPAAWHICDRFNQNDVFPTVVSRGSRNFLSGWGVRRRRISPDVIYRRCTQWTVWFLYGKGDLLEINSEANGGHRPPLFNPPLIVVVTPVRCWSCKTYSMYCCSA